MSALTRDTHARSVALMQLVGGREGADGVLLLLVGYNLYPTTHTPLLLLSVCLLLSFVFFTHVINDIFDYQIDQINKRDKPLVKGTISMRAAKILAAYFGLCTLFLAFLSSDPLYVEGALALLLLGILYSHPATAWSKRPAPALLAILLGSVIAPVYLGIYASTNSFPTLHDHVLIFSLCVMVAGRVALKDVRDRKGDREGGRQTLALILQTKKLLMISNILIVTGAIWVAVTLFRTVAHSLALCATALLYAVYISTLSYWQAKIPEEAQHYTICSMLIKLYVASRLYILVLLLLLYTTHTPV